MRSLFPKLSCDEKGATIVEFAAVIPVLTAMLLAIFDLGYRQYLTSVLQGEVQQAGRHLSLRGGALTNKDLQIRIIQKLLAVKDEIRFDAASPDDPAKNDLLIDRRTVQSFDRAGKMEPFTDKPHPTTGVYNGTRDDGECYTDENSNNKWDELGLIGGGNADDIVKVVATFKYKSPIPIFSLFGWPETHTISATSLLRNQPYDDPVVQTLSASTVCIDPTP